MEQHLFRFALLLVLIYLLTAELKEFLDALSTTAAVGPLLQRSSNSAKRLSQSHKIQRQRGGKFSENVPTHANTIPSDSLLPEEIQSVKLLTAFPSARRRVGGKEGKTSHVLHVLTEDEKQKLISMKNRMTKVMQEWCLPKLVCEIHATVNGRSTVSEAENSLLTVIRDSSMNSLGEVISKYHFAAHMGQLLADVEGNGCHNFYPNCPLSGMKVLQMVQMVKMS